MTGGTHQYVVTPGIDSEMEILYGMIRNDDTAANNGRIQIMDSLLTREIVGLIPKDNSIPAGGLRSFPNASADTSVAGNISRLIVSGTYVLHARIAGIAVSQDTEFSVVCRVKGLKPTVAITAPTGATVTVNIDEMA